MPSKDTAGFTVVIPARNAEATIVPTLRSVLAQTLPAERVIVVDDGSVDRTAALARTVGDCVEVITGAGEGVARARNLGVGASRTKWVAFLDADDTWREEHLAHAASLSAAHPHAVALFMSAAVIDDDRTAAGSHVLRDGPCSLRDLALGRVTPTTSAAVAARSALQAVGGFYDGFQCPSGAEDFDLWLRMSHAGLCVCTAAVTADYVLHSVRDRNRTQAALKALNDDRELVATRLLEYVEDRRLTRQAHAIIRARTARYYLLAGYTASARRCALSSLATLPTLEGAVTLSAAVAPQSLTERARMLRRRHRARIVQ
jgi:glycosyltransferase involved in cell wall biosynthesis